MSPPAGEGPTVDLRAVDAEGLPLALHHLHRSAGTGERRSVLVPPTPVPTAGLLEGAGFSVVAGPRSRRGAWVVERRRSLADTVGPGMRVLVCGLNPSLYAADAGVGFARPGNRFWPAMAASGLGCERRDPVHLLEHHGVGMTDLVKRATVTAGELTGAEYRSGLERVEALCGWLAPAVVCFVGLAGWRAAVDRRARTGLQPGTWAGVRLFLMPSTSGLNASSRPADFAAHLGEVRELARMAPTMPPMARHDVYIDHLSGIPMFSECSKKELQLLARRAEDIDIPAGEVLVKEGRTGREFFVIVKGAAQVTKNGRKVAQLGPGDYFGELALLEQVPRTATVTAASDMEVVVLDRREFSGVLNDVPSLSLKLCKGMAKRLRDADARSVQ